MRYDVKKEINQIIQDNKLSKAEKIQKIKDVFNSANTGGVTGNDTKDSGGAGNAAGDQNGNGTNSNQNGNQQGQGQGGGNQSGQNGQNGSQGQQGNQNGQGQNGQGQNGQGQGQNNGVNQVSHNQLKNQGVGQNGQGQNGQQGNQSGQNGQGQNGQGQNGQQGNQSGQNGQGQNGQQSNQSGQNGQGQNGQQGNQSGQQSGQSGNGQGQSGSQNQQSGQQGNQGNQSGQGSGSQGQQGQGNQQQGQGQQSGQQGSQGSQSNQQGQQNQNGQGQGQQQLDEFTLGKILGRKYAEEMYKHRGLAPIMRDIVELPKLDPMKIMESLNVNESIDDDIEKLLDDNSIDFDEKTNKIHDLFRNEIGGGNGQQTNDNNEIYVPDDVIVMRNGVVDDDNLFTGKHVIDQNIGDEIRKEQGITPKDPDWGMSDSEDAMIREAFPILDDIFKPAAQDDKEIVSAADKMKEKIKGRIRKSREGIIDWKKALEEFVSERSHTYTKGPLRKNVYQRTGIGLRHRVRAYNDFNKCVVYIDTSGSVNNSQTQLIPIMAGEIGKIMQDCHFNTVDIHLFDDVVYNEHFDVDSYTVADEEWGIESADNGGGTNIHEVYKHIINNYMDNGELNYDINAIIIITDVSGMQYSGNVKPFASKLGKDVLERMLYVIYNDYQDMYLKDVTAEMDQLVSKYSQHYEISVENFRKQILGESMNINQKRLNVNEALGNLKKIQQKQQQAQQAPEDRSEEEKQERLRKAEIQGARAIGQLDRVLPELIENLEKFFPYCHMVKEYTAVMASPNTYYVTEEAHVILHMNIDKTNIKNLCDACAVMNIDQLIGNIELKNDRTFQGFPVGFPKEVGGNMVLRMLPSMRSLDNAPQAVTGRVSVDVCYPLSKHIKKDAQNAYLSSLKNQLTPIGELENGNKPKVTFSMTNNESVQDIINKRIRLGQQYINEAIVGAGDFLKGSAEPQFTLEEPQAPEDPNDTIAARIYRQKKAKYDRKFANYKKEHAKWVEDNKIGNQNREVFFDVIDPLLPVSWGDIPKKDVTINKNLSNIRDAAADNNYYAKHKDFDDQKDFAGIRLFTNDDDIISAVYAKTKRDSKYWLVYLLGDNGEHITDREKIIEITKQHHDIINLAYKYMEELGIEPANIPDKSSISSFAIHIAYIVCTMLLGLDGSVEYKFKKDLTKILNQTISNMTPDDAFNYIMNFLFGSNYRSKSGDSYIINTKYTVNFDQSKSRQPSKEAKFYEAFFSSTNPNRDVNPYDLFSDNFIKFVLIGASLRGVDEYPHFDVDVVQEADRDELLDMVSEIKDAKSIKSALKCLKYRGKEFTSEDYRNSNPSDVLLLYPDKCEKEYVFRVDVDESALEKILKQSERKISKANMAKDIKRTILDRKTGQRHEDIIKGTWSTKKVASQNEQFEALDNVAKYIIDNKGVFDKVGSSIKNAINEYKSAHSWYKNDQLEKNIKNYVNDLKGFYDIIKSEIMNNEDYLAKTDQIESLIENFSDIIEKIEAIVNPDDPNDYRFIIDAGEQLVKNIEVIKNIYKNITGASDSETAVLSKKLAKKNTLASRKLDKAAQDVKPTVDTTKYEAAIKNVSDSAFDINKIAEDVAKNVDFSTLSRNIRRTFPNQNAIATSVSADLNDVIEIANGIAKGDGSWISPSEKQLDNISLICKDIIDAKDDNPETVVTYLYQLSNACGDFFDATDKFSTGQSAGSTYGYTA